MVVGLHAILDVFGQVDLVLKFEFGVDFDVLHGLEVECEPDELEEEDWWELLESDTFFGILFAMVASIVFVVTIEVLFLSVVVQ